MKKAIPKEWKVEHIGNLCEVGRGSSPRPIADTRYFEGGTIPWIKIADATKSGKYLYETKEKVNEYGSSFSRLLPRGSLIVAASGTLGHTQFLGVEGCIHDGWLYLTNYRGVDRNFLYYFFKWKVQFFYNSAYGAAIQNINTDILREMEIVLPPTSIQEKIASILSAYDDLIENNNRRIKISEEMAQAIYKEWFVNFRFPGHEKIKMVKSKLGMIPEGWEVKNLFDIAEITYGSPFQSKLFTEERDGNKPVIRIRDILNNFTKTYTPESAVEKYIVQNGDILVGMDGDFHMGKWSDGEAYLNQRVARFRPLNNISSYFLFLALRAPIQHFNSTIVGTTVAHLGDSHLKSINLLVPDERVLNITKELLDLIYNLEIGLKLKNSNLRKTRDLLLPRLISGEVDVENFGYPDENEAA